MENEENKNEEIKEESTQKKEVKEAEIVTENKQDKKETTNTETKGYSIASMVLGIISLILCCVWYISVPASIAAIILGVIGRKKAGKGMATAGLVMGIITLVLLVILVIIGVVFGVTAVTSYLQNPEAWEEFINEAENISENNNINLDLYNAIYRR